MLLRHMSVVGAGRCRVERNTPHGRSPSSAPENPFYSVMQCNKMGNLKSQTIADEACAVPEKHRESLHRQHHLLPTKIRLKRRRHEDASVLLLMRF
jgi:hypothetical protein